MSQAPPNNRITLTTETLSGFCGRILILGFFGGLAIGSTLFYYVARDKPIDSQAILCVAFLQLSLFGTGVFGILCAPRGTWVFDDDGVTYHPCLRRSRTVAWQSVDLVNWRRDAAILKSSQVKIPIPWRMFKEVESLPARAFTEAKLSPEFDLKDVVLPGCAERHRTKSRLERLMGLVKLAGIAIAIALPLLTLFLIAVCFATARSRLWSAVPYFAMVTLGMPWVYAFVLIAKDVRARRRVHPEWPWRLRRSKTLVSAKVGGDPWTADF